MNLGAGRLAVREAKTDAGERTVDLTPDLLSELKLHKQRSRKTGDTDLVFTTRVGTPRDRNNVRGRVLLPTLEKANKKRAEVGLQPIQDGVTNHSLRRTFASLLYECGASPAYVMGQMGHTSSALALDVYARVIQRKRDTGERVDALLRGADWAQTGTNPLDEATEAAVVSAAAEGNASVQAG